MVFWSFFELWGYFDHFFFFLVSRGISVIFYLGYFGHFFGFRGYFGHFLGFGGILVIFWILEVFWSFLGFEGILVIFWVLGVF